MPDVQAAVLLHFCLLMLHDKHDRSDNFTLHKFYCLLQICLLDELHLKVLLISIVGCLV